MPCMLVDTQNECNPNRQNKTYSNPNSLVKIQYNQNTTKTKEPNEKGTIVWRKYSIVNSLSLSLSFFF